MIFTLPEKQFLPPIIDGDFILKRAETKKEFDALKKLRFSVFYEERNITPPFKGEEEWEENHDPQAEHFIVIDKNSSDKIIVTYRITAIKNPAQKNELSSAREFDIEALPALGTGFFELGRVCVAPRYRHYRVMMLIFKGIATVIQLKKTSGIFGTASFLCTDLKALSPTLSLLHHNFLAPPEFRARSKATNQEIWLDQKEPKHKADCKNILHSCPTLIKFYLQIGCKIGEGIYIDHEMKTIDIFIINHHQWIKQPYKKNLYGMDS